MSRIFMSLSLLPVVLVLATMGVGWWIGDYNGISASVFQSYSAESTGPVISAEEKLKQDMLKLEEPQRRFVIHFQLGLASSLAVVLINSLSVTYLIGTSRWVKEVCDAYELGDKFINESNQIKRSTFPWSIAGVLSIIAIIAFGAAADPGTQRENTAAWVTPHLFVALLGTSVIVFAIFSQAVNLHRNTLIIEEVVNEVKNERVKRGLPIE